MRRGRTLAILTTLAVTGAVATGARHTDPTTEGERPDQASAASLLDRGLRLMGGIQRLKAVTAVRFDMMTQWQRISFDDVPYPDRPSFERHVDVRDYTIPAWRNTREFERGGTVQYIVNVIRDSVGTTDFGMGDGPRPQSIAYVDERQELFGYTPDRLMLWARHASDLRAAGDTTIAGVAHTRVSATVNGIPMTLFLRAADGLPTLTRFRKDQNNDFGLVPWGEMDVEVWYSNWRTFQEGISIPTQWDTRRAGASYKRMTVLSADFDPEFAPDSFLVAPELRAAYLASPAVRPMHDRMLDSARVVDDFLVDFRSFGSPGGAILVGDAWVLLEAGQAPLNTSRALDWIRENTAQPVKTAVVGAASVALIPHGGITELLDRQIPFMVGPGTARLAPATLAGYGHSGATLDVVGEGRWIRQGGDSLRVETLDLADVRGAVAVWSPTHRWVWAPDVSSSLDLALLRAHAEASGWTFDRFGTMRGLVQELP